MYMSTTTSRTLTRWAYTMLDFQDILHIYTAFYCGMLPEVGDVVYLSIHFPTSTWKEFDRWFIDLITRRSTLLSMKKKNVLWTYLPHIGKWHGSPPLGCNDFLVNQRSCRSHTAVDPRSLRMQSCDFPLCTHFFRKSKIHPGCAQDARQNTEDLVLAAGICWRCISLKLSLDKKKIHQLNPYEIKKFKVWRQ